MHGQLDLWLEWVWPQEKDRLCYTMTHTQRQKIASGVLKGWEELIFFFLREHHIPVKVPAHLPEAKIPPAATGLQVPKSSSPGSPWSLSSPGSRAGRVPRAPPGRNPQGRGPWRWRLSDALLLTIAFLLP